MFRIYKKNNMHQCAHKITLCCIALLISACSSYKVIEFNVLIPPNSEVARTDKALLIDNVLANKPEPVHLYKAIDVSTQKNKVILEQKAQAKVDSVNTIVIQGCLSTVSTPPFIDDISVLNTQNIERISALNANRIFAQYPSDAYIMLQDLSYSDVLSQYYYGRQYTGDQELVISTASEWIIFYENDDLNSYSFSVFDTLYWSGNNYDRNACIEEALWVNGEKAGAKISPSWKNVTRIFYTGENMAIRSAAIAVQNGEWEEAAKIWISIYNGNKKDSMQKGRMAFNMAVFFESNNKINLALEWLDTATKIYTNKEAQTELSLCESYRKVLNNRIIHNTQLDKLYHN